MMTKLSTLALVLLAGCGEIASTPEPEPLPDPIPDPTPPAPTPPVKVTVLSMVGDGLPDPTAIAVFVDASGAVLKDVPVDAAGHAEAEMPNGGQVHALRLDPSNGARAATIQTLTGVEPGDDLRIGLEARSERALAGGASQMTGTFTSAGTNFFHFFFSECGALNASSSPFTLTAAPQYVPWSRTPALARSSTGASHSARGAAASPPTRARR